MYQEITGIHDVAPAKPAKKSTFEKDLKKNAEASAKKAVKAAKEPKVIEVENPFEKKKAPAKKSSAKKPATKKSPVKGSKKSPAKA